MPICRYFAQGNCRYGDRCRFEHIQNNDSYNYNQRNVGYGRQESGYSNYYRNDYQQRNQRYESRNYYDDERNYSPERYTENYRYQTSTRSGGYNQYQNRYKEGYEQQPDYSQSNYGRNKQYSSNYHENENVYGQNRFRWLSDDYKKQNYPRVEHGDSYSTSTPKGKVPFSFKVPESEIKKGSETLFQVNEQDQFYADLVKEDAKSWELGGQWPFTCYFPSSSKHGFPGFYDVSPEELRYAAYKAEKNNSYESYVQNVQNALMQVNQQRSQLQVVTPQLLSTLRRIWDGEDLYSTSKVINPIPTVHFDGAVIENMETPVFSAPVNNASSFSFKVPTEMDSSSTAANFSFKLPSDAEIKAVPPTISDGDTEIYTPMGSLSEEEKEQFQASTFVLGKIPTKPPPQVLCT